jgi:pimeloyl-ACP methyl ester carboxylesterase
MSEQLAPVGGLQLAYETIGDPGGVPTLLVAGLGSQMLRWDEGFCGLLADRGRFVVRFDNRDVGRSSSIDGGPRPDVVAALGGDASSASYTLEDMADDAVGLLDHLSIDAAQVIGVSMGGMIAQTMAIRRPERLRSLVSIMSTTGDRDVGRARHETVPVLLTPAPREQDAYVDYYVGICEALAGRMYEVDEARERGRGARMFARGINPEGTGRQLLAVIASGDRTAALASVRVPTLVLHGDDDPLIDVSGGRATAAAIPGALLTVFPGMGHELPAELWPVVVEAVVAT